MSQTELDREKNAAPEPLLPIERTIGFIDPRREPWVSWKAAACHGMLAP